ncbi:MAG: acylphosphatase, partial [Thermoplasmata archaeon]
MSVRATILITGDVQEAGYRALVFQTAQELKLSGYVENLRDGRVKIVCEGKRKTIEELCKRVRIRDEYVEVKDIKKRFSRFTGQFERFDVRTGDLSFEIFQGYATAGRYFRSIGRGIEFVGEKVEDVGRKVDGVGEKVEDVGRKVDGVGEK